MQELNFCWGKISDLAPRMDKCFNVLDDYVEKQFYFSGLNGGHFML